MSLSLLLSSVRNWIDKLWNPLSAQVGIINNAFWTFALVGENYCLYIMEENTLNLL